MEVSLEAAPELPREPRPLSILPSKEAVVGALKTFLPCGKTPPPLAPDPELPAQDIDED